MNPTQTAALLERWRAEERPQPDGWSFADLAGRVLEDEPPWDLTSLVADAARSADSWLDLGTGGGEWLSEVLGAITASHRPRQILATEGWAPNVEVARRALAPLGVEVHEFGQPDTETRAVPMPFPDDVFQLITSRHENYHPEEVARVLTPGGLFLTQQVTGDEVGELHEALGYAPANPQVRHGLLAGALEAAGLVIEDGCDWRGHYTFDDVAALVAYLQRVPWDAPEDFSVDAYADELLRLHEAAAGDPLRITLGRFWIAARLPAAGSTGPQLPKRRSRSP